MKNLHIAIPGAALALIVSVWAQTTAPGASNASPKVPVDPGAIIDYAISISLFSQENNDASRC